MTNRPQLEDHHIEAARDVPTDIALDENNSVRDRLQAAKMLGGFMKMVWENDLHNVDLTALAKANPRIIYVREDENFFGNNAHQLQRERAAREAEQEAAERRAAGLPVEGDEPSEPTEHASAAGDPPTDGRSPDDPSPTDSAPTDPIPPTPPKRRWNEDPPLEPWDDEDDPVPSWAKDRPPP